MNFNELAAKFAGKLGSDEDRQEFQQFLTAMAKSGQMKNAELEALKTKNVGQAESAMAMAKMFARMWGDHVNSNGSRKVTQAELAAAEKLAMLDPKLVSDLCNTDSAMYENSREAAARAKINSGQQLSPAEAKFFAEQRQKHMPAQSPSPAPPSQSSSAAAASSGRMGWELGINLDEIYGQKNAPAFADPNSRFQQAPIPVPGHPMYQNSASANGNNMPLGYANSLPPAANSNSSSSLAGGGYAPDRHHSNARADPYEKLPGSIRISNTRGQYKGSYLDIGDEDNASGSNSSSSMFF